MKTIITIITLLFFVNIGDIYAQDQDTANIQDTTLRYDPHTLGLAFRFGGIANSRGGHLGVYNTVFEFYTRERKGRTKYTPMVGIRLSQPLGGVNPYTYGGFRWGFLFGGSQYVFDMRSKELGTGWSMLVNGGVTADMPSIKDILEITRYPITLGAELEFKAIYNVHKYMGVSFGLHLGYAMGIDAYDMVNDMINDTGGSSSFNLDHGFTWGISAGMIF